jgi:antitoxin component YwqK of YwqJK toxin-antitoxin module
VELVKNDVNFHLNSLHLEVIKVLIMLKKKLYTNGQPVHEMVGEKLIYYFKNGKIKAEGQFINNMMEGEWIFYRETGQLWVIGNFKNNVKNGIWIRYNKNDKIEYQETFENGKIIKKKK